MQMDKRIFKFFAVLITVLTTCWLLNPRSIIPAEDKLVAEISDMSQRDMDFEAFCLDENVLIHINAVGKHGSHKKSYLAYGWILDGETRRIIWNFSSQSVQTRRDGKLIRINDEILLPKGYYELYYVNHEHTVKVLKEFVHNFWDHFSARSDDSKKLGIKLYCSKGANDCQYARLCSPRNAEQAIIQMIESGNSSYRKEGFSLSREMDLRIYAIGEGNPNSREMFDYAWIVNARSMQRVWEMTARNTEPAGGATKNRLFDDIISLPAGDYLVYFVSDDSHSFEEWNALPPHDPRYWGITVWGISVNEGDSFVKPYEETPTEKVLIAQLTRMRDNEYQSQGFSLKKSTRLRIYALGEAASDRDMVDYGWIIDARSRKKVWQMQYEDSEHAGGGHKNRLFDGTINLPAGDYIVYYITDDSHSYRDWNVGPPFNPEAWGITIWADNTNFDSDWVTVYREDEDPALIAQIIRVNDDEKVREKFTLTERTRARIYAIGEGDRNEMYDYGWIEDSDGRIIWKMTYRHTSNAGGARKNRQIDEIIALSPGIYYLVYKTDDSHSYERWNAPAPDDPIHWGITLMRIRNE